MDFEVLIILGKIAEKLTDIDAKVDKIMSDQATEAALAAQIEADVAADNTALAAIQTELANAKAANPGVDFTALEQAVTDANAATAAEQAVAAPPTA